ncbi:15041_t:CDS:2, partial [Cetraspora pellucida]
EKSSSIYKKKKNDGFFETIPMFRHLDVWNEPLKVYPDRFYNDLVNNKERVNDKYDIKILFTMFGGGLRICPGRKLAIIELKCLMAMVYRKYDVELVDIDALLKTNFSVFITCKELLFRLKLRK